MDLALLGLFSGYESVLAFLELSVFSTDSPQSSPNHKYLTLQVFRTLSVLGLLLKNQSSNQAVNPMLSLLAHPPEDRPQLSQEKQSWHVRLESLLR